MEDGPTITLPESAEVELSTDRLHRLIVPAVRLVALRLLTFEHEAIANAACRLRVSGRDIEGTTDGDGKVSFRVVAAAESFEAQLVVETDAVGWDSAHSLELAPLPDVSTPEGQRIRLDNLGYVPVFHDEPEEQDAPSTWAIEEFQCEHGLAVDGDCGPNTQAKLVEVHGH